MQHLKEQFGNMDIYLFDQLLKGNYTDCERVLDLGCGSGRNCYWFLKNGYEVHALDKEATAVVHTREMARRLALHLPDGNFVCAPINADMPFKRASFDLVICNAVLHFAEDEAHFEEMLHSAWAMVAEDGYFFARLASIEGMEGRVQPLGKGRYLLPDGSERYLVSDEMLQQQCKKLNAKSYEYIKTTLVEGLRAMTTICWRK
jgi:SAM-dependent methyltransferase